MTARNVTKFTNILVSHLHQAHQYQQGPKQLVATTGFNALAFRQMSSEIKYDFDTLKVSSPSEYVKHVELNRPDKRNALNMTMTREIGKCFSTLADDPDCRVVIFSGAGKVFSSGIDLNDSEFFEMMVPSGETSRRAFRLISEIRKFQEYYSAIEKCPKPVIVAIHNVCLGLAMDLICACDIRVCTQDAWFQIKEVDLGIAADIGVLQRFPRIIGNDSLARELIYTARKFEAPEAKSMGFVSKVYDDQAQMMDSCLELGRSLASKGPVALQGSKVNIVYSRDHGVKKGLEYMTTWNMSMLQSEDVPKAAASVMTKETPEFSKL